MDRDGIDDAYELFSGGLLNPLDAADALLDPDEDQLTTVEEYLQGNDPFNFSPNPATINSSPQDGEDGVAVTRKTIIYFSRSLTNSLERINKKRKTACTKMTVSKFL